MGNVDGKNLVQNGPDRTPFQSTAGRRRFFKPLGPSRTTSPLVALEPGGCGFD